ncbi:MAG: hypothetical protein JXB47_02295 [Anaerolineae bacterium]|nr:hypothetical protein [Anaerolineae bacterium]
MKLNPRTVLEVQAQRRESLRRAENERLARIAQHDQQYKKDKKARFHRRLLVWLGRCLMSWGARLQAHGDAASAVPLVPGERS